MDTLGKSADDLSAVFFEIAKAVRRLAVEDPDGLWNGLTADAEAAGLLCQASTVRQALADGLAISDVVSVSLGILDLAMADLQAGQTDDARQWGILAFTLTDVGKAAGLLADGSPDARRIQEGLDELSRELGHLFGFSPLGCPADESRRAA
jgi:hypothetical protein